MIIIPNITNNNFLASSNTAPNSHFLFCVKNVLQLVHWSQDNRNPHAAPAAIAPPSRMASSAPRLQQHCLVAVIPVSLAC